MSNEDRHGDCDDGGGGDGHDGDDGDGRGRGRGNNNDPESTTCTSSAATTTTASADADYADCKNNNDWEDSGSDSESHSSSSEISTTSPVFFSVSVVESTMMTTMKRISESSTIVDLTNLLKDRLLQSQITTLRQQQHYDDQQHDHQQIISDNITPMNVTWTITTFVVAIICYHLILSFVGGLLLVVNRRRRRRRRRLSSRRRRSRIRRTRRHQRRTTLRVTDNDNDENDDCLQPLNENGQEREIRIFVEGAFDMFHFGHMNAFRLARTLGTKLIVGVNSDSSITECKGTPLMNEQERLVMVSQCKFVDEVVEGTPYVMNQEYLNYIFETHKIDFVVHGDDPCIVDGRDVYEDVKAAGKFRSIPRTEGVSTTDIVGRMLLLTKEHHILTNNSNNSTTTPTSTTVETSSSSSSLGTTRSKFLTTTRLIRLFSADYHYLDDQKNEKKANKEMEATVTSNDNGNDNRDMKVIYIDGSWDMFNPSHVALLKNAKERGDFLIVGIHSDSVVNSKKGMDLPLLNLHERVLSVNGCRYVDDVLIDAPYEISPEMIGSLGIKEVVHGMIDGDDALDEYCSVDDPRYNHAKDAGIFHVMKNCRSDFRLEKIFQRIKKNQETFQERFNRKMEAETNHLKQKYGGGDNASDDGS